VTQTRPTHRPRPGVEPLPAARSTLSRRSRRFLLGWPDRALALRLRLTVCAQLATLPAFRTRHHHGHGDLQAPGPGNPQRPDPEYSTTSRSTMPCSCSGVRAVRYQPVSVMAVQAVLARHGLARRADRARLFGRWPARGRRPAGPGALPHLPDAVPAPGSAASFWLTLLCYLTLRAWRATAVALVLTALVLSAAVLTRGNALLLARPCCCSSRGAPPFAGPGRGRRRADPGRSLPAPAPVRPAQLAPLRALTAPRPPRMPTGARQHPGSAARRPAVYRLVPGVDAPADLPPDQRVPVTHHILPGSARNRWRLSSSRPRCCSCSGTGRRSPTTSVSPCRARRAACCGPVLLDFLVIGGWPDRPAAGLAPALAARLFLTGIVSCSGWRPWCSTSWRASGCRSSHTVHLWRAAAQHGRFLWH